MENGVVHLEEVWGGTGWEEILEVLMGFVIVIELRKAGREVKRRVVVESGSISKGIRVFYEMG